MTLVNLFMILGKQLINRMERHSLFDFFVYRILKRKYSSRILEVSFFFYLTSFQNIRLIWSLTSKDSEWLNSYFTKVLPFLFVVMQEILVSRSAPEDETDFRCNLIYDRVHLFA